MIAFIIRWVKRIPVVLQLLRFGAIGFLNTALDFAVFNVLTTALGIVAGSQLGAINIVGFLIASSHSYFWNRYWTFGANSNELSLFQTVKRLIGVGSLGVLTILAIVVGSNFGATTIYYLIVLLIFATGVMFAWLRFGLHKQKLQSNAKLFLVFVTVTVIGLIINSTILALLSSYLMNFEWFAQNADLTKNLAKMVAVVVSLIWNFIGYKLIVFRQ